MDPLQAIGGDFSAGGWSNASRGAQSSTPQAPAPPVDASSSDHLHDDIYLSAPQPPLGGHASTLGEAYVDTIADSIFGLSLEDNKGLLGASEASARARTGTIYPPQVGAAGSRQPHMFPEFEHSHHTLPPPPTVPAVPQAPLAPSATPVPIATATLHTIVAVPKTFPVALLQERSYHGLRYLATQLGVSLNLTTIAASPQKGAQQQSGARLEVAWVIVLRPEQGALVEGGSNFLLAMARIQQAAQTVHDILRTSPAQVIPEHIRRQCVHVFVDVGRVEEGIASEMAGTAAAPNSSNNAQPQSTANVDQLIDHIEGGRGVGSRTVFTGSPMAHGISVGSQKRWALRRYAPVAHSSNSQAANNLVSRLARRWCCVREMCSRCTDLYRLICRASGYAARAQLGSVITSQQGKGHTLVLVACAGAPTSPSSLPTEDGEGEDQGQREGTKITDYALMALTLGWTVELWLWKQDLGPECISLASAYGSSGRLRLKLLSECRPSITAPTTLDGAQAYGTAADSPAWAMCPLTMSILTDPVQSPYVPERFLERAAVIEYVSDHGHCPLTFQQLGVAQLLEAPPPFRASLATYWNSIFAQASMFIGTPTRPHGVGTEGHLRGSDYGDALTASVAPLTEQHLQQHQHERRGAEDKTRRGSNASVGRRRSSSTTVASTNGRHQSSAPVDGNVTGRRRSSATLEGFTATDRRRSSSTTEGSSSGRRRSSSTSSTGEPVSTLKAATHIAEDFQPHRRCVYGAKCHYLPQGRCTFYHTQEERRAAGQPEEFAVHPSARVRTKRRQSRNNHSQYHQSQRCSDGNNAQSSSGSGGGGDSSNSTGVSGGGSRGGGRRGGGGKGNNHRRKSQQHRNQGHNSKAEKSRAAGDDGDGEHRGTAEPQSLLHGLAQPNRHPQRRPNAHAAAALPCDRQSESISERMSSVLAPGGYSSSPFGLLSDPAFLSSQHASGAHHR